MTRPAAHQRILHDDRVFAYGHEPVLAAEDCAMEHTCAGSDSDVTDDYR